MKTEAECLLEDILKEEKEQTLLMKKIATDLGDLAFLKRTENNGQIPLHPLDQPGIFRSEGGHQIRSRWWQFWLPKE